jgi:sortase A
MRAVLIATAILATACGGDGDKAADTTNTTVAATTTTAAPTTAAPTTAPATLPAADDTADTEAPATTEAATTTTAPTTTTTGPATSVVNVDATAPLPVPIPVPADSNGPEPEVKLGTIEIPKLDINETMFDGIRLTTLDKGPGHWPGTAMPGDIGNVVVAGHRVSHSKPFRHIERLVAGDEVIFTTEAGRFVYTVVSTEIVQPNAIYIIDQTAEKTGTLFACHPPGSTAQRIVVHMTLADDEGQHT